MKTPGEAMAPPKESSELDTEHTSQTISTVCKIGACEPFCGISLNVEGGKITRVKPDPAHPISEGYVCIKGMNLLGYQNAPDRLLYPLHRKESGWSRVSWDDALGDIGARLHALTQQFGPRAVATYWGNAADSIGITMANTFCHAFGSPNSYNVLSLEYTDRGIVAEAIYGNENLILQPDVKHAKYALLLGTNPIVTQGLTLLQRRPHVGADLKHARKHGGKLVVLDPQRTQTARMADLHVPIRPGTDLFFLLGMLHVIVQEGLQNEAFIKAHTTGFAQWRELAQQISLQQTEQITGVKATTIQDIARDFAAADGAYISTRVGVQTSHNSTLTEWVVATLVAITGNIDRTGGLYFNPSVLDIPGLIKKFTKRKNPSPSRIGNYPPIFGGLPCAVLADEILTPGEGQVRALIVIAGNPVISFPNTPKIEEALQSLDLLVVIDIFHNDTASFADYVLPAATQYERGEWHFLTSTFDQEPFAEFRPKVVEPPGECRGEWEIFKELSRKAKVPFLNNPLFDKLARFLDGIGIGFTPELLRRYLLFGKTPSYSHLKKSSHGAYGKPFQFGHFFTQQIHREDRRIQLAPPSFVEELQRVCQSLPKANDRFPFVLISGARRSASFNSWTHNIPALVEKLGGNWAILNQRDGDALGIREGDNIRIRSACGEIEIEARLSTDIAPGVVAVHQHWGHVYDAQWTTANKYPGVNVNHLHSHEVRDTFSGMAVFNGTPVSIEKIPKKIHALP